MDREYAMGFRLLVLAGVTTLTAFMSGLAYEHLNAAPEQATGVFSDRTPIRLLAPEVRVQPGDKVANVRLQLSRPADFTIGFSYATRQGADASYAYAPTNYGHVTGNVKFEPGEIVKTVPVELHHIQAGQSFFLDAVLGRNWPEIAGATAKITVVEPKLVYATDFIHQFRVVDPGKPIAGAWENAERWGRVQTGNREIAPYTSPILHGTQPYIVEGGVAYLQAERLPVTEGGKRYEYSAPMITLRNAPIGPYADIELVARLPRGTGISPAFWMMPASGKRYTEVDFFENQQWPGRNADRFNVGQIFGPGRDQWIYNAIDSVDPQALNSYRVQWHPDWTIISVNNREIARWRTKLHEPGYLILNIAVGGLTANPNAKSIFPARMELRSLKVWAYP
jgi:hypothetical protein